MKDASTVYKIWFFLFIILIAILPLSGQTMNNHSNLEKEKQIVLEKDREISRTSAQSGVLKAFYPFMTDKSILLPTKGHPVLGKETCANLINRMEMDGRETSFKWEPLMAEISAAGDLAYTHGRYELSTVANKQDDNNKLEVNHGYYGTIWIKIDRNWKVVFSQGLVLLKGLNQKPLEKQFDPAKVDTITREVLATEKAFSDYSVSNGQLAAFYHYIDDNGIALGSRGAPKTKEYFAAAIKEAEKKKQTSGNNQSGTSTAKLEWEALYSHVAASGDMAYNFGTYVYTPPNAKNDSEVGHGYFLTVWKKQSIGNKDGNKEWRFIFDCGNEVE